MGVGTLFFYALYYGQTYILRYPRLTVLAVVVVVLRTRVVASTYWWLRTRRHRQRLERRVAQNPNDAIARRDLAAIWLQRGKAKRAAQLLTEARLRDPYSAELAYLAACAALKSGEHEAAIDACIDAAEHEPKLRYGDVYRVAASALIAQGRLAEAEDALSRLLEVNASSVEGWARLARVRRRLGDADGARAALRGAVEAFEQSPRFHRRAALGWYLRARLLKGA